MFEDIFEDIDQQIAAIDNKLKPVAEKIRNLVIKTKLDLSDNSDIQVITLAKDKLEWLIRVHKVKTSEKNFHWSCEEYHLCYRHIESIFENLPEIFKLVKEREDLLNHKNSYFDSNVLFTLDGIWDFIHDHDQWLLKDFDSRLSVV